MSRVRLVLSLAALVVAGVVLADPPNGSPPVEPTLAQRRVVVAEVESGGTVGELRFSGVTRALRRAQLAFTVPGRLEARPVEIGDEVSSGTLLARLDAREAENAVSAARASVQELEARADRQRKDRQRVSQLAEVGAATQEELESSVSGSDALDAALQGARVRLAESRRLLGECSLHAPFAGTVVAVHAEAGENVAPGRPVVSLQGTEGLEVAFEVPESLLVSLEPGMAVALTFPAYGRRAEGRIESVARAGGAGGLFPVEVAVADATGLVPGLTTEVSIRRRAEAALSVPVEAVVDPDGESPVVFRVLGDRVERVIVEVARLTGERVVLRGGLEVGDLVVVGGQRSLLDGDRVEVVR